MFFLKKTSFRSSTKQNEEGLCTLENILSMENTDRKPTSHQRTSASRAKKEKIVAELLEKVNKAKGLVFTSYQGLTHKQLEGLKKKVQALDADFVATKNSLVLKAMEGKTKVEGELKNATATLFLYGDPVMPLKELAKMIKELSLPTIKFGILDGIQMTSDQLLKLSTLPSKEVLLTQLVVGLKSPISGLHRALNWNLQKFVMTLKAIENEKLKVKN